MLPELQDGHAEGSPPAADCVGWSSSSCTSGGAVANADGHDSEDPAHHHHNLELPHRPLELLAPHSPDKSKQGPPVSADVELSAPRPSDKCKEAPLLSAEGHSAASSVDSRWARRGLRRRSSAGQDSDLSSLRMRFSAPSESGKSSSPQTGLSKARVASKAGRHPPGQSMVAQECTVAPPLRQHPWLLNFWDPGEAHQTCQPA